jgi:hypothetical protein
MAGERNICFRIGRWRFIYLRGPVVQIGPWRDGGVTSKYHPMMGLILIRWWSFGRLFIERLWSHVDAAS